MPFVKSLTSIRVATLSGYTVLVEPDTVQFVPQPALAEVLQAGCAECDAQGKLIIAPKLLAGKLPVTEVPKLSAEEREDPVKRQAALVQAIAKLYNDNDPTKFNADEQPRVKAVEALVAFPTSAAEIAKAIEQYQASL